ncbi:MAG TPA: DUF3455 domain-containing protein [Terriglobales bacterium]
MTPQSGIPREIQLPDDAELVLRTHASGVQIYVCQEGADGKLVWTLKGPEATLYDEEGAVVGSHFLGPTWKHKDGSEITARAVARLNAPDATAAIPWLLLSVTGHLGNGAFSRVGAIHRINTDGGQPPPGNCSPSSRGVETRIEYTADYYFYFTPK